VSPSKHAEEADRSLLIWTLVGLIVASATTAMVAGATVMAMTSQV
jgi:hypothetical protein